jgi:hypothetical protein
MNGKSLLLETLALLAMNTMFGLAITKSRHQLANGSGSLSSARRYKRNRLLRLWKRIRDLLVLRNLVSLVLLVPSRRFLA